MWLKLKSAVTLVCRHQLREKTNEWAKAHDRNDSTGVQLKRKFDSDPCSAKIGLLHWATHLQCPNTQTCTNSVPPPKSLTLPTNLRRHSARAEKGKKNLLNCTNNITVNQEKGKCEKELREKLRKSYKKKQSTYNYKEVEEKIINKTKRQQK